MFCIKTCLKKFFAKFSKAASETQIAIYAPVTGFIVDQKDIPDDAFSTGMLGTGLAIKPDHGDIATPMVGKVSSAWDTGHAYTVQDHESGVGVLVHLGVDTVNIDPSLNAFQKHVEADQHVKHGDLLGHMDLAVVEKHAPSDLVITLVQNDQMENKEIKFYKKPGTKVEQNELIMMVVDKRSQN